MDTRPPFLTLLLDEGDRPVGQDVGDVPLDLVDAAILIQLGVGGPSLSGDGHPPVETGPGSRIVPHVPLAEVGRLVAVTLKGPREGPEPVAGPVPCHVVDDAVAGGVLPGEDAGPVGRTERHRVEGMREHHPFAGELVDMGRFEKGMPGDPQLIPSQVVDDQDDDIGTTLAIDNIWLRFAGSRPGIAAGEEGDDHQGGKEYADHDDIAPGSG